MMTSEVTENVTVGTMPTETAPANEPEAKSKNALLTAKRLEKVDDHLRESLDRTDSLEANLGVVSADLMRMACRFTVAIEESLSKKSIEHFDKLVPAIDAYLRIARQIDRLAMLDRRLTSSRAATTPPKPR